MSDYCTKFYFGWGSTTDLTVGGYKDALTEFNRLTSKEEGAKVTEWDGRKQKWDFHFRNHKYDTEKTIT